MTRITERIKYADAGRKLRLSRQRLAESELGRSKSPRAWRVWAACIEATASYSKGAERIYVSEIAKTAGMRPDKVSPILMEFDRLGVFGWKKDKGRRSTGFLTLPALDTPQRRGSTTPALGPYLGEGEELKAAQKGKPSSGLASPSIAPPSLLCPNCGADHPEQLDRLVSTDSGGTAKEPMIVCPECSFEERPETWSAHQDVARELHRAKL